MVDTLREPRTMILCALPYPPLPITVNSVAADELVLTGDLTVTTTHSIIARCIHACVELNDKEFNKTREAKQRHVLQEFRHELGCGGFDITDPEKLYKFYCKYNYKHICTYFKDNEPRPEVNFLPLDHMAVGDKYHKKLVEYHNAQAILFDEKDAGDVSHLSAHKILFLLRDRMGHSEDLPNTPKS
jgi:hypothetical protein